MTPPGPMRPVSDTPVGIALRDATPADLPAITALRAEGGFAIHPWAMRELLQQPHARFVLAVRDGRLVGMGSAISYGSFGVVGNMVTAPAERRRGVASAILSEVLAFLRQRGVGSIELSATAMGRPLYERFGFAPDADGHVRVTVPRARLLRTDASAVRPAGPADLPALAAYDRPRFGGDRSPLLAHAIEDPEREVLVVRDGHGAVAGYLVARPVQERIGPWVADSDAAADALLAAAFASCPQADSFQWVIPSSNAGAVAWARHLVDVADSWAGGMRLGPPVERRPQTIYANSVGALG